MAALNTHPGATHAAAPDANAVESAPTATGIKRNRLGPVLGIALAVFAIAYPMIVYLGLTRLGTRFAACGLVAVSVVHTIVQSRQRQRIAWRNLLVLPLCLAAFWLDDRRYMLAMPVLMNSALFAMFFGSLYGTSAVPICERFARMQVPDLTLAEQVYCRSITKVWSAFFVVNGGIAAALAVLGKLDAWTLYTGLIAYILIGTLAGTEYTVRKYRFGRYGDGPLDRMLRAVLPSRSTPP